MDGATTYEYDGLDRLAAKTTGTAVVPFTYTVDGLLDTVTDASGVTRYTYDTMNGLTDVQYPDGTYLHYVYDTAFRLTSIQTAYGTTGYAYDLMNRLTSVTDLTGAVTTYTYDANGNRSTMTYANGVTTSYDYDTCNRLTAETVTDSAGTILESYTITLGAAGERTQIVELHRTVAYEYDSLYRLTKETISADGLSKETAYTYDAMGNRLTKTSDGVVTSYTYNVLNQLLSENDIAYTYDANGSQVSQQGLAKTAAYTYDQEDRLITAIVTAGGTTTTEEYRYNWTGIRNAKITDGVEIKYLIDPNGSLPQVMAELDSAGSLVTFYTRGAELISLSRTGETRYYQYDANGSVRLLTDGAGAVTDTYTYDAFGNLLGKTGTTINNYLYNGEQFDANTGFYYLRARYMNPSTGTFISMDPAQGSIFDPVSLHKYLYANANPVMNSDPSGRSSEASLMRLTAGMAIQSMIESAYLACQATAIALFNSLSASLLSVMIASTPLAMFVANNSAFTDLCMKAANGEISFDTLREFLKDLYYRIDDQVSKLVDRIDNGNSSNSNNSSNNGPTGDIPPPIDPNVLAKIKDFIIQNGLKFSDKFSKSGFGNQVENRGWTDQMIRDVINNPYKTGEVINNITGNPATRFYLDSQYYIVIDNVTCKIIQVADLKKSTWT